MDAAQDRPRTATAEALDAIGARTEDDGFMALVNTVLAGETGKLAAELRRLRELGLNPVAVLLAVERRTAQLAQLAARLGPRGRVDELIEAEKKARRIFFKDDRDLRAQLKIWQGPRLARLVDRLAELHRSLLANSHSAELLLGQGLATIAREAGRAKGR